MTLKKGLIIFNITFFLGMIFGYVLKNYYHV